jgi:hypothetical protein
MRIGLVLLGTVGLALAAEAGRFGTLKGSRAPADSDDGGRKEGGKAPATVTDRRRSKPQDEQQQLPKITSQPIARDDGAGKAEGKVSVHKAELKDSSHKVELKDSSHKVEAKESAQKVEAKESAHKVEPKLSLESAHKGSKQGTIKSPEEKKRKPVASMDFEGGSGKWGEAKAASLESAHKAEPKGGRQGTIKSPGGEKAKRKPVAGLEFDASGRGKERGSSHKKSVLATAEVEAAGREKGAAGHRKKPSIPGIFGSTRRALLEPSRSFAALFEGASGEDSAKMKTSQQMQTTATTTTTNEQSLSESDDDGSNDATPLVEKRLRGAAAPLVEKKTSGPQASADPKDARPREANAVKTKKQSLKARKERCQSWDAHHNQKISTAMPVGAIPQTEPPETKRGYHSDGSESEAEQDPEKRKEMVKTAKKEAGGRGRNVAPRKAVGGTRLEDSDSAEYVITASEEEEEASQHLFKPEGTGEQEQRKPRRQHQYGNDHAEEFLWHPPGQAPPAQSAPQMAGMNPFLVQQQLIQQQMLMMQSMGMGMGMPMPPMGAPALPGANPQQQPAFGVGQAAFQSAPRSVKRKAAPENPAIGPFGMASKLMVEGVEVMQQQGDGGEGQAGPSFPQFNAAEAAPTTALQQAAMVPQLIPMMTPFGIVYMPATAVLGPPHPDDEGDLPDPLDEHVVLNFIATTKKGKLIAKNMWRLFRMVGMAAVWVGVVLIIWFFGLENMILDIPVTNTTTGTG